MRFDWIDFGPSWTNPVDGLNVVDPYLHNSTSSLLSSILRRRQTPFRKVFCSLTSAEGVLHASDSPEVRYIEASFPIKGYTEADDNDRLWLFAKWLIEALVIGAPELGIRYSDLVQTQKDLADRRYTYRRMDKVSEGPPNSKCAVEFSHMPSRLKIELRCKLPNGIIVARTVDEHRFQPDELQYARSIFAMSQSEDGNLQAFDLLGRI